MEPVPVDGPIELLLPADTRLVRVIRLVASGLATTAGFDVDQLEDLRIGVDEAVAALLEGGDGSPLALTFHLLGTEVTLAGSTPAGAAAADAGRLELSARILDEVVDHHELGREDGRIVVQLQMRRTGG